MLSRLLVISVFLLAGLQSAPAQQSTTTSFEVTTIKPSQPDTKGPLIGISAGRLTLTGFTLKEMMGYAFWIHATQIVGASGWMDSEKFDVVAKPEKPSLPEPELRKLFAVMLADRFALHYHHDTRALPAYVLSVDKGGSRMKARTPGDGGPGFRLVFQGAQLPVRYASMDQLAFVLQAVVLDRPVINRTGLAGNFDFDLAWMPNETQFGGRGGTMTADADRPDLFTAMREQLGLRLDSERGPADVLVIDHAERPAAN